MKKIRLKICNANFSDKFSFSSFFLRILSKYYEVELSENPDYVIYNDTDYEYLKYDGIRIFFSGENISPNFNLCDYAVGCDYLTFGDRYYRMPLYLIAQFYTEDELKLANTLLGEGEGQMSLSGKEWQLSGPDFTARKLFTENDLKQKTGFCSFVYSNYLADGHREEIFNKLNAYKTVGSGGAYLNNIGGRVKSKLDFEYKHKFSIAFENSSRSGYTTEKLTNALVAQTIPIYWGNPDVAKEFNPNRFINCHTYRNFDEVVEMVKEIDQNNELFLKIINEPVAAEGHNFQAARDDFEKFLCHIFDEPLHLAKRRTINSSRSAALEAGESVIYKYIRLKYFFIKIFAFLYQPLKRIVFLDRIKQKMLARVHKKS